jgi:hypothetical protein
LFESTDASNVAANPPVESISLEQTINPEGTSHSANLQGLEFSAGSSLPMYALIRHPENLTELSSSSPFIVTYLKQDEDDPFGET